MKNLQGAREGAWRSPHSLIAATAKVAVGCSENHCAPRETCGPGPACWRAVRGRRSQRRAATYPASMLRLRGLRSSAADALYRLWVAEVLPHRRRDPTIRSAEHKALARPH